MRKIAIGIFSVLLIVSCVKKEYTLPTTNPLGPDYSGDQFIFIDGSEKFYDTLVNAWSLRIHQHVNTEVFGNRTSTIVVITKVTRPSGSIDYESWGFHKDYGDNKGNIIVQSVWNQEEYNCEMYVISGGAKTKSYLDKVIVQ